ncbi:unnamed protein product [Soboliphyme baturini]|uniref:Activin_recp domain-containing protein n=1 Tax=Soboliphyme baturini TaxID=241478 RepID=A0A183IHD9_9BILA|nr:unnamed protein product [Soboliphyme baturini]
MTNTLGLCNFCSAMRILPSNYYPRFINEVVCDDNDTGCLSNYGFCKPKSRAVEVFVNNGTQENAIWTKVFIIISVSCECYVQDGSELHEFVST